QPRLNGWRPFELVRMKSQSSGRGLTRDMTAKTLSKPSPSKKNLFEYSWRACRLLCGVKASTALRLGSLSAIRGGQDYSAHHLRGSRATSSESERQLSVPMRLFFTGPAMTWFSKQGAVEFNIVS